MRGAHGFALSLDLTSVLRICARRAQKLCITGIFRLLIDLLHIRSPFATSDLVNAFFDNTMIVYHLASQFNPLMVSCPGVHNTFGLEFQSLFFKYQSLGAGIYGVVALF